MKLPEVTLLPLQSEDREQFILDNQWAFKYGAQQEFGMRDDRVEEGEEVISRKTIEDSIDGKNAEAYRIADVFRIRLLPQGIPALEDKKRSPE